MVSHNDTGVIQIIVYECASLILHYHSISGRKELHKAQRYVTYKQNKRSIYANKIFLCKCKFYS